MSSTGRNIVNSRLVVAALFAATAISSCGGDSEKVPLAPGEEGDRGAARNSGLSPIPGFSVRHELSPSGVHSPVTGSGLEDDHIPREFRSGGPGKDGIPALTNPNWVDPAEATYVREEDLVLGLVIDGVPRSYPENILWWHEIVNDEIGEYTVSVTRSFCIDISTT